MSHTRWIAFLLEQDAGGTCRAATSGATSGGTQWMARAAGFREFRRLTLRSAPGRSQRDQRQQHILKTRLNPS
jgi:hypothetical protein